VGMRGEKAGDIGSAATMKALQRRPIRCLWNSGGTINATQALAHFVAFSSAVTDYQ
jgi:hypothetical protein